MSISTRQESLTRRWYWQRHSIALRCPLLKHGMQWGPPDFGTSLKKSGGHTRHRRWFLQKSRILRILRIGRKIQNEPLNLCRQSQVFGKPCSREHDTNPPGQKKLQISADTMECSTGIRYHPQLVIFSNALGFHFQKHPLLKFGIHIRNLRLVGYI